MRNRQGNSQEPETLVDQKCLDVAKGRLVFAVASLLLICALALLDGAGAFAIADEVITKPTRDAPNPFTPTQDYSKFSHSSPKEHADLTGRSNCAGCHRQRGTSLEPKLPVHKDCTGCHLIQFTNATSSDNPICTICHTKDGLNSSNPPTKTFPRLRSFNAEFDHAQHLRGIESARPGNGCAACHSPANRGVAETIPARLGAHQTCYQCHSLGEQASKFSSCDSCHKLGRYSPTSVAARSYRGGFSHAEHGPRKRLTCESCHNVLGRGLPQARQVSSISPVLHRSSARARSCMTCHNGQRAFGATRPEFNDCKRCHKGPTFKS